MKYMSTRNKSEKVSASFAIKEGLSKEGGLFVPEEFPALTNGDYDYLKTVDYKKRAAYILNKYLVDFSMEELEDFAEKAYGNGKFPENTTPVYKYDEDTYYLELWHGPTCAFKDMALQMLPHLLISSAKKEGDTRTVTILVATSGDTGKAALDGFADVEGSKIIVFYPKDGVSEIQKLQMITQKGENVFVSGINGNFDDAQSGVKNIFTDEAFNALLNEKGVVLSSANSINWGRLVPQIVYYISSYVDLMNMGRIKLGDKINVCVPTGNFGNILAAYYAKKMGLPINKLICASNSNNILTDFLTTGVYDRNREFILTMSPSMDILISSNLERYLFDISKNDDKYISDIMDKLKKEGRYEVTDEIKNIIKEDFFADFATEEETAQMIKESFEKCGYLMDTHTAVAGKVMEKYREKTADNTPVIIASTASPYKFNTSVLKALGESTDNKDEFELLSLLNEKSSLPIPDSLLSLKTAEKRFTAFCEKENQKDVILEFLG